MFMQKTKYLVIGIVCFILGAALLQPVEAASNATIKWVKKNFFSKREINKSFLTQKNAGKSYLTKSSAASTYLTQTNALTNFLSIIDASSIYLTQSNASSTYLTQNSASSTYMPKTGGTFTGNISTNGITYSPAITKTLVVPSFSFVPDSNLVVTFSSGELYKSSGAGGYIRAGLNLPQGATITAMRAYYRDSDGSNNIMMNLFRRPFSGASSVGMASVSSSGGDYSSNVTTDFTDGTIDNSGNIYYLTCNAVNTSVNLSLLGVQLDYTTTSP